MSVSKELILSLANAIFTQLSQAHESDNYNQDFHTSCSDNYRRRNGGDRDLKTIYIYIFLTEN